MGKLVDDTWTQDGAICPHCFHEHKYMDSEDLPWKEDGESEIQCRKCEAEFIVVCTFISYSRESKFKEQPQ